VPSITRKTDKGLPRYYDAEESDEYILSSAEDLVPNRVATGVGDQTKFDVLDRGTELVQRYRPRVEGSFALIERHTDKTSGAIRWQVTTKDNVTHVYGRSVASQVVDPKNAWQVFTWLLEESRDDRGNAVRYEYKAEDGAGVSPTKTSERSRFDHSGDKPMF